MAVRRGCRDKACYRFANANTTLRKECRSKSLMERPRLLTYTVRDKSALGAHPNKGTRIPLSIFPSYTVKSTLVSRQRSRAVAATVRRPSFRYNSASALALARTGWFATAGEIEIAVLLVSQIALLNGRASALVCINHMIIKNHYRWYCASRES